MDMRTGMQEKYDKKLPSKQVLERKLFRFFLSHLLALISRNVGRKGHLRKGMLKYRYFRLSTKTGAHLELLN